MITQKREKIAPQRWKHHIIAWARLSKEKNAVMSQNKKGIITDVYSVQPNSSLKFVHHRAKKIGKSEAGLLLF